MVRPVQLVLNVPVCFDRDAVGFLQMSPNVAHAQAAGVHVQDLVVEAVKSRWCLGKICGSKLPSSSRGTATVIGPCFVRRVFELVRCDGSGVRRALFAVFVAQVVAQFGVHRSLNSAPVRRSIKLFGPVGSSGFE